MPAGYHTVTPHLVARDAAAALTFYARAFGAIERYRLVEPSGKIGHAEFTVGDAVVMIADEYPDFGALAPPAFGGSPIKLLLHVDDCDAVVRAAVDAGATLLRPVKDQFHGDRSGMVVDPAGFTWTIATRREDVSPDEMQRRFTTALAG